MGIETPYKVIDKIETRFLYARYMGIETVVAFIMITSFRSCTLAIWVLKLWSTNGYYCNICSCTLAIWVLKPVEDVY